MQVSGKCHCARIVFRAEVDPNEVVICHCTDCQTLTGSPYRVSVPARSDRFELISGEPKIYVKIAEDGTKRGMAFCSECGTPIYGAAIQNTPSYNLRVGCIDQRASLPPQRQIWCRSALPWSFNIEKLPKLDQD